MFFILAQICGVISFIYLLISYHKDNVDKILLYQIVSTIFCILNYLFLGAISGLAITVIELIRDFLYYKTDKDDYIFLSLLPIYLVIAYFTGNSFLAMFPILGSILDGAILIRGKKTVLVGAIITSILWLIYDIVVQSYAAAVTDFIIIVSNLSILIYGYSIFLRSNKIKVISNHYMSRSVFNTIYNTDKKIYSEDLLWDIEYQKNVYLKNKDSFVVLKDDAKVIGYINYLSLKKEAYDNFVDSKKLKVHYDIEDVINFSKNKSCYLIIDAIVIDSKYQNKNTINKTVQGIKKMIKRKIKRGIKIKEISSIAVNDLEKEVLEKAGFSLIRTVDEKYVLYTLKLDNKENFNL